MVKEKYLIPEKKQNCTEFDNPFYCDAVAFNTYPFSTITHAVCKWGCVEYLKNTPKYRGKKCLPNFVFTSSLFVFVLQVENSHHFPLRC